MKIIGFTKEGYDLYMKGVEWNAIDVESETVIDTILTEGSAEYYGDDGSMVYLDKYDLEVVYL